MTITRSQMYRQLYQMGGQGIMQLGNGQEEPIFPRLETLSQNLGQAEQTLGQPSDQFNASSITTAITGRPQMNLGGRIGYQEGDMAMMQPEAGGMMQDQMIQQPQIDPSQMNPKQALELIIQMLIAQGIPPEQAKEIAIQMVQAVAEGGMQEMSDERVEARFGGRIGYASGGIGSLVGRQGYFLGSVGKAIGSVFKGAGKLVSGAVNAVKKVASSDLGKAALTVAAIYASGGGFGISPEGFSLFGSQASPGLLGAGSFDLGSSVIGQGLFGTPGTLMPGDVISGGSKGLLGNLGITSGFGTDLFSGGISSLIPSKSSLFTFLGGTALGKAFGGEPKREDFGSDEEYQQALARWNATLSAKLNEPKPQFAKGLFPNNPFYPQTQMAANGGRIGYQEGGIGDLIKQTTQQAFFGTPMMANGGRMGYGFGDLVRSSNVVSATSTRGDTGGGGGGGMFGNMISRLISQNPNMFKPVQVTSSRTDFIDLNQDGIDDREQAAYGGRMGYALGAEVPMRENQAGVQELDYRQTGGFVPPIGIKERADDIPAMLSNNEFVFTADAVRNAGGGNVNKGAERMYSLMKNLEAGGRV